jgi:hypothetical protein
MLALLTHISRLFCAIARQRLSGVDLWQGGSGSVAVALGGARELLGRWTGCAEYLTVGGSGFVMGLLRKKIGRKGPELAEFGRGWGKWLDVGVVAKKKKKKKLQWHWLQLQVILCVAVAAWQ